MYEWDENAAGEINNMNICSIIVVVVVEVESYSIFLGSVDSLQLNKIVS